jgi:exonuclease VII small subunit
MRLLLTTAAVAALALPSVAARAEGPAREDPGAALRRARAEFERAQANLEVANAQLRDAASQKAAAERALAAAQNAVDKAREEEAEARALAQQGPKPKASKKGGGAKLEQILHRLEAIEKRLDALEKMVSAQGQRLPQAVYPADQYPEDAKPAAGRR